MIEFLERNWTWLLSAACAAFLSFEVTAAFKDREIAGLELASAQAQIAGIQSGIDLTSKIDAAFGVRATDFAQQQLDVHYLTQTLIREVPQHVTPETDRKFPLPCGLVRMHDAAAIGVDASTVPNPPGKSDDDACDVKASEAASIIAENYGVARDTRNQVIGLQGLLLDVRSQWEAARAKQSAEGKVAP